MELFTRLLGGKNFAGASAYVCQHDIRYSDLRAFTLSAFVGQAHPLLIGQSVSQFWKDERPHVAHFCFFPLQAGRH